MNGRSANGREELIAQIDELVRSARELADDGVFLGRTEGRTGRSALWCAEDFQLELEHRVVPSLERLKRALRDTAAAA